MWSEQNLHGWGCYPTVPALCTRPERRAEVIASFEERGEDPVLAHGLGRSYGDAALLRGGRVVLTRRLDRILAFDPETGWVRCEGGVSIADLVRTFLPRGFFVPVVPGTQFVTVGGAIASDIHGKNHHVDGTFADHVRRVEVLTGSGEIVTCDADTEPDLFWASVGGQGLTGLILAADLRLVPVASPWIELETVRVEDLDAFFRVSAQSGDYTHTVSWIDSARHDASMGRGIFMRGRHAPADAQPGPDPLGALVHLLEPIADLNLLHSDLLLNRASIALFNEAFYRKTPAGLHRSTIGVEPFFFPLDAVRNWNRVYGPRGFLQYQLVVPHDPEHRVIRATLDAFASAGMYSFLTVLKEFGATTHPWLSFPRPGVTLALDIPNHGEPLLRLMDRVDALVAEAGGRIYLSKDARLSAHRFRQMYPDCDQWAAVRDRYDPHHVFQSELGRRLGLC